MPGVFRKTGPAQELPIFEAEAAGLEALAATGTVRVPRVHAVGVRGDEAFIEMERLALVPPDADCQRRFGAALAALHRTTSDAHGWPHDNWIGRTPQPNTPSPDWVTFFGERRLLHQLELASRNGYGGELQARGRQLVDELGNLFDERPAPSLLHGDLWGGNWGMADGEPVTYDPAVHYGDRESDLAMTRLFGGFGLPFYEAYDAAWPPAPGRDRRVALYQLYHVLNHLNLFGAGYLGSAMELLRRLTGR